VTDLIFLLDFVSCSLFIEPVC